MLIYLTMYIEFPIMLSIYLLSFKMQTPPPSQCVSESSSLFFPFLFVSLGLCGELGSCHVCSVKVKASRSFLRL